MSSEETSSDSEDESPIRRRGRRRGGRRRVIPPPEMNESSSDDPEDEMEAGPSYERLRPSVREAAKGLGDLNDKCIERTFDKLFKSAELASELFEDDQQEYDEQYRKLQGCLDRLKQIQGEAIIEKQLYDSLLSDVQNGQPGSLQNWKWKDEFDTRRETAKEEMEGNVDELASTKQSEFNEYIKRGDEEDEKELAESDDDLVVQRADRPTRCPITQIEFDHPVKSKKCKHVFEKSALVSRFKQDLYECPVQGCNTVFRGIRDFARDIQMEKYISRRKRRQEEQEEEQEDVLDLTMPV